MDLSFLILWNYSLELHDYCLKLQDKLIYTNILMTDSSLISSLSRYGRILKALRPQRFYSTLILDTIKNVENFPVSFK